VESSGDEVERSLYRVKREMFAVQIKKAPPSMDVAFEFY
jgi:hypothetical protein